MFDISKPKVSYHYIAWILWLLALFFIQPAYGLTVLQQTWPTLIINKDLTDEFLFNITGQSRINMEDGRSVFKFYSPSIGYKVTPNIVFWNAYWWGTYDTPEDSLFSGEEQRLWQRVDWTLVRKPNVVLLSQSRFDERKETAFNPWAYRYRQRFQLSFPQKFFSYVTPVIADEVFINLNQPFWVPQTTFQQNRAYAGLSAPIFKNFIAEGGYLNQFQIIPGSPNIMTHVVYFSLTLNL